jgi:hypothetical protein
VENVPSDDVELASFDVGVGVPRDTERGESRRGEERVDGDAL